MALNWEIQVDPATGDPIPVQVEKKPASVINRTNKKSICSALQAKRKVSRQGEFLVFSNLATKQFEERIELGKEDLDKLIELGF
jgi:hypothetical protein